MLEPGQPAPDFSLPRDGGDTVSLSDFRGKKVILFFYPKADTSGCTKEAIGFSELKPQFEAEGVVLLGASKDSVAKQEKFRDKHGLTVPLLSDEAGNLCENYGVWQEKKMYGKTFMGIVRTTFLIGEDGTILHVWNKVKVPGHAEAVLETVKGV